MIIEIMDKKSIVIIVLVILVLILLGYIMISKFREGQELIFQEGLRQGQLLEQRNIIAQIQASGVYVIPVINENNETINIRLGLIQQEPLFVPEEQE